MKNYLLILICVVASLKATCQTTPKNDDKTIAAVKTMAQGQLQTFITSLNANGKDIVNFRFLVQSEFVHNGIHEHLWTRVFEYKDGAFKGKFIGRALKSNFMKVGEKVTVPGAGVEDWSAFDQAKEKSFGDFTLKYLESKKPVAGKKTK
jgi:uncharacterized protein YegJ (DUF2314 family)